MDCRGGAGDPRTEIVAKANRPAYTVLVDQSCSFHESGISPSLMFAEILSLYREILDEPNVMVVNQGVPANSVKELNAIQSKARQ